MTAAGIPTGATTTTAKPAGGKLVIAATPPTTPIWGFFRPNVIATISTATDAPRDTAYGAPITLDLAPGFGTAGATLVCEQNTAPADHGAWVGGGCAVDRPGKGYRLRATAPGKFTAIGTPFEVTADGRLLFMEFKLDFGGDPLVFYLDARNGDGTRKVDWTGPVYRRIVSDAGPNDIARCAEMTIEPGPSKLFPTFPYTYSSGTVYVRCPLPAGTHTVEFVTPGKAALRTVVTT